VTAAVLKSEIKETHFNATVAFTSLVYLWQNHCTKCTSNKRCVANDLNLHVDFPDVLQIKSYFSSQEHCAVQSNLKAVSQNTEAA
jgi:hypothetical protein